MGPELYGQTAAGEDVHRCTLRDGGLRAQILTFGCIVEALHVPERDGAPASVVLGLRSLEEYTTRSGHLGAIAGRFANRIAEGRFSLDGSEYELTRNDGPNALHGGPGGLHRVVWQIAECDEQRVVLRHTSPDGTEGYPGTLDLTVTYTLAEEALRIEYGADTDKPTVLNLTNHSYFNLGGEGSGDVMGHIVQMDADTMLPQDATGIPTGERRAVGGSPFDFRAPQRLGARIREADEQIVRGRGYDHCWMAPGEGFRRVALVQDPGSGRAMQVWTDQPGVQMYTANKLDGTLVGPSGRVYRPGDGVCFETQHVPDSPNQPSFPSTVLRPGERFESRTEYRFSAGAAP